MFFELCYVYYLNILIIYFFSTQFQIKPEPNTLLSSQGQSCSDDSCSDDEGPKRKYREMLTRRPSYRKILNDLGGAEIAGKLF